MSDSSHQTKTATKDRYFDFKGEEPKEFTLPEGFTRLLLAQLSGKILNAAKEFSGGALITVRDRRPRGKILFVVLESKTGLTAREIRLLQVFLCRNDVIVATKSGISGVSADLIISDESEGKK